MAWCTILLASLRLCLCWLVIAGSPLVLKAVTQQELDASRNLWDSQAADHYDYVMQRSCFCLDDFVRPGLVEVRSGQIVAVTDTETLQALNPEAFLTVNGLFDELQNAIDVSAFEIQAQFDNQLGYPTSISIDFEENLVDDEVSYRASELSIVPEPTGILICLSSVAMFVRFRRGWNKYGNV